MSALLDAQDKISEARHLIAAVGLAAAGLHHHQRDAIQAVCEAADGSLEEAQALLDPPSEENEGGDP